MCGICGATHSGDGRILRAMNARMVHRGPDDEGVFVDPSGVGLGARRLEVIDPAGGHQPVANEEQTVWAVLNGEIYNFPALREKLLASGHVFTSRTDTEVLVHLYEEHGEALVDELDGMFAFAIWDSRRRRLLLARDRFGEKPLFYSTRDGKLVFASELTALLAGLGGARELSPAAIDAYFVYGYVPGDASIVEGVQQLEPGHKLVWDGAAEVSKVEAYWRPPVHARSTTTKLPELVEQTAELLQRSVASRLVADVPVGVFLSGGLDSTLIAALAAKHVSGSLKTFTVDYDVGRVGERVAAKEAAAAVGADHHELIFTTAAVRETVPAMLAGLDQPIADPAFVPLRALSVFARRDVTVAVGGEGADELFGGYPRYRWLARTAGLPGGVARISGLAAERLGRVPRFERLGRLGDALAPGTTFDRHVGWVTSNRSRLRASLYGPRLAERSQPESSPVFGSRRSDVLGELMRLDQSHWLPDDVLAKADRASMGASLELRTPFLSPELAAFAASVPATTHVRGGGKLLLRKVLEKTLPAAGRGRTKAAFRTPCADWLRGPLAPILDAQLEESALYRDGWFDRGTVAGWVARHRGGHVDLSSALWPLLVLGCWVDGSGA